MEKRNSDAEEWAARIAAQRESGRTQKAWCKDAGISVNTMRSWIRRLGLSTERRTQAAAKPAFVKVVPARAPMTDGITESATPTAAQRTNTATIDLTVVRVKFPAGIDREAIIDLIRDSGVL